MKRYIEIVYDNSGSMNGYAGKKIKYEIARELFEKEILPIIANKGDNVVLRLLSSGCELGQSKGESLTQQFGTDRKAILSRINSINHDQSTPLFYTIADAIEACRKEMADEYCIFVLTDGDDTCSVKINELIDQDLIDKFVKYYKVLLVQLAIDSKISRNNLTALTSYLGGQTVILGSSDSTSEMRSKMKKALSTSGFSKKLPLEHCYNSQPGFDRSWEEIQSSGIDFHQAQLLYNKNILSWEPDHSKYVSALELAELKFLYGLSFKSRLSDVFVKTMLSQLKKPYYYSHDCIYWDFSEARWKYFVKQNIVHQIDNPNAKNEDGQGELFPGIKSDIHLERFRENYVYKVEFGPTIAPSFVLEPLGKTDYHVTLKQGDRIIFMI